VHVLLVYMYYLRPGDSGIKRHNEFARLWTEEHGLKVTVLAMPAHNNSGEFYPDCAGRRVTREHDGAVDVWRVGMPDTWRKGYLGRTWAQWRWAQNARALLRELDSSPPDVVLGSSPPLWASAPALAAKRRWRIPLVLEIRDIWPEAIVRFGLAGPRHPAVQVLARMERQAHTAADHVVNIFEGHRQNLLKRGLVREDTATVIPHGVLLEPFDELPAGTRAALRAKLGVADGQVLALYAGAHGPMYNLHDLVEVAEALRGRADIQLATIGEGFERAQLAEEAVRRGLKNLRFLGPVPSSEVPAYLSAADISLSFVNYKVLTGTDQQTHGAFRNALFDYAAARLPVVFNDAGYAVQEVQDRAKAGLYADTRGGAAQFAAHVQRLADSAELRREMGENNYREIAVRYNRRKMAQVYAEIFARVAAAKTK
jgi:glycosyltransferase involved in cell wall biosynthesis